MSISRATVGVQEEVRVLSEPIGSRREKDHSLALYISKPHSLYPED
jgi:hypothetical protein